MWLMLWQNILYKLQIMVTKEQEEESTAMTADLRGCLNKTD